MAVHTAMSPVMILLVSILGPILAVVAAAALLVGIGIAIYNEYNKQLKQLFTDIKHALNPEFWVNPDKILKLEEKQNETSTSCCDS